MSHSPQNRSSRLVVVGSSKQKPRKSGPRWWGPKRPEHTSALPSQVIRMVVMPTLSRNVWYAALLWMWNFVRSYFVNPRKGRAAVLSFPGKKESGSVRWNRDCAATPQEGGRA